MKRLQKDLVKILTINTVYVAYFRHTDFWRSFSSAYIVARIKMSFDGLSGRALNALSYRRESPLNTSVSLSFKVRPGGRGVAIGVINGKAVIIDKGAISEMDIC
ncbi:8526_t:CDS:1 [Ambispora leptoticha]|uniref:8526_t:CDS:1 n=1 Tax=Ambispora leptoticha TaxID=144679 RepID=A0A9N9BLF2_9GLOM|nr:8526_t:CDS:1 [Ambispora leptoticha]